MSVSVFSEVHLVDVPGRKAMFPTRDTSMMTLEALMQMNQLKRRDSPICASYEIERDSSLSTSELPARVARRRHSGDADVVPLCHGH